MSREFNRFTICGYDRSNAASSGTGVGLVSLVSWLAKHGITVQVLMLYLGHESECPYIQSLMQLDGVHLSTLSMDQVPYSRQQTRWILECVREFQPDVFCANYAAPGIFAARNIVRVGTPVVVVLHSTSAHYESILTCMLSDYLWPPATLVTVSNHIADKALTKLAVTGVRGVSAISCGTQIPDRFVTVGPGVNIRIVYAGRFIKQGKRIFDVANAMIAVCAQIPYSHCTMIGDGPEWAAVNDHVRLHDGTGRVKVLSAVPNNQLRQQLLSSHVFLLLSEYEGLPVALLEAMAAGLVPIGFADVPGISEVIRDDENGILVSDRQANVVSAVRSLAKKPGLWLRLSKQARNTVIENYALDVENAKWLECCTRLCSESFATKRKPSLRVRLPHQQLLEGDRRLPPLNQRVRARLKNAVMAVRLAVRPRARIRELRSKWGA